MWVEGRNLHFVVEGGCSASSAKLKKAALGKERCRCVTSRSRATEFVETASILRGFPADCWAKGQGKRPGSKSSGQASEAEFYRVLFGRLVDASRPQMVGR